MGEAGFSYETFLSIARVSGLDVENPHMRELYDYLREILPGLKRIEDLDLSGVEPMSFPRHPLDPIDQEE